MVVSYYANDFIEQHATSQSFLQCISAEYTWYARRCSRGLDGKLRHAISCINGWRRKLKLNLIVWFEQHAVFHFKCSYWSKFVRLPCNMLCS